MTEPVRISPEEARRRVLSGSVLFVCAYEYNEKFRKMQLEGAISLHELRTMTPSLSRDQEIIFYCA